MKTQGNDNDQKRTDYISNTSVRSLTYKKNPRDLAQVTRPGTVNSPGPAMLDCEVCRLEIEKNLP